MGYKNNRWVPLVIIHQNRYKLWWVLLIVLEEGTKDILISQHEVIYVTFDGKGNIHLISFQYIYIVHLNSDFCRFSNALQFFLLRPLSILCHSTYLEGETHYPRSLPGEHTCLPSHMRQYLFYHLVLQCSIHSHTHSWQIEVWWLGMFQKTTCSFMCTSHIHMTSHTLPFYELGSTLGTSCMFIWYTP